MRASEHAGPPAPWQPILIVMVLSSALLRGEEAPSPATPPGEAGIPAGHSFHGEVFNAGPRQKAYLMGTTGKVHFPVTVREPAAREFFDQGVGQLHGFWYFEAERSFRQVFAIDPACAMAHWGMAMANFENEPRARGFIEKAAAAKENVTPREQMWIDGLAAYLDEESGKSRRDRRSDYIRSLEAIIHEFPEDIEAKAFLAVRIWQFKGDLPISSHEAVDALLAQVFAVEPMHPAHHYRIHLWDTEKPERALASAARCGQASPGIAHMWHMPGHIYSRLERYNDACWQQEASARVDHAHMIRDRVLPDQIHNYAHNNEWLIRNLVHVGRVRDAVDLAKNMIELPRHPEYNTLEKRGSSAYYGRRRLFEVLERYELWDEMLALGRTRYLEATSIPEEQARRLRALGLAHAGKRDRAGLARVIGEIAATIEEEMEGRTQAVARAEEVAREAMPAEAAAAVGSGAGSAPAAGEGASGAAQEAGEPAGETKAAATSDAAEKAFEKARKDAASPFDRRIEELEEIRAELRIHRALVRGDTESARTFLEDNKGVDRLSRARLLAEIGDLARAEELAREDADSNSGEVLPLACWIDVLWDAGKKDEAKAAFEELREIAVDADLEAPAFRRLEPLAAELGLGPDWRLGAPTPDDVGDRPDLDSLGPLHWSPPSAPAWKLPDAKGGERSLADYSGRPVVVIFYLGHGCLHCVEQLETFAPRAGDFERRGIALVAISSETLETLAASLESFETEGPFPFPLVADPELEVFKAYRAYDDFEGLPLHGTFLIDPAGRVLWQDVSYEPFTDVDFCLDEAARLLGRRRARL